MSRFNNHKGFTLIELVIVIIIAGVLAAVALRSVVTLSDTARTEETKQELEELEYAIIGNPAIYNDDTRADFGYVGDVGALPANLDALFTNPGGYASWNGPYVKRRLEQDATDYKVDAWGTNYAYSGAVTVTSSGSGSNIVRKFGEATSDFVGNGVDGVVLDLNGTPPGAIYNDSVSIRLTVPNGSGSYTALTVTPDNSGFFSINAVPIGNHDIMVIYSPTDDTLNRFVSVLPKSRPYGEYILPADVWFDTTSGGGVAQSVIIRPIGNGSWTQNNDNGCGSNWQCVYEVSADNDATYIGDNNNPWETDTYQASDPAASGTIDSVVIFINVRMTSGTNDDARTVIVVSGTRYYGAIIDLDAITSYTVFSTRYAANPQTSSSWSWTDINNLQIGVDLDDDARCTQIWAVIHNTN